MAQNHLYTRAGPEEPTAPQKCSGETSEVLSLGQDDPCSSVSRRMWGLHARPLHSFSYTLLLSHPKAPSTEQMFSKTVLKVHF